MAERPKRARRTPDYFAFESSAISSSKPVKRKKDNALYEIEVKEVDRDRNLVRIHYKGYGSNYDEWRPFGNADTDGEYFPFLRQEKVPVVSEESVSDRSDVLRSKLYREIKKKLHSSKKDDPQIRIEIDAQEDAYNNVLGSLSTKAANERGRLVQYMESNLLLDVVLGINWDKRIFNCNGDFAYVVDGTVKFWLARKSPIVEYKFVGHGKLLKSVIEDTTQVVFTFVRGDGNKHQYEHTNIQTT